MAGPSGIIEESGKERVGQMVKGLYGPPTTCWALSYIIISVTFNLNRQVLMFYGERNANSDRQSNLPKETQMVNIDGKQRVGI